MDFLDGAVTVSQAIEEEASYNLRRRDSFNTFCRGPNSMRPPVTPSPSQQRCEGESIYLPMDRASSTPQNVRPLSLSRTNITSYTSTDSIPKAVATCSTCGGKDVVVYETMAPLQLDKAVLSSDPLPQRTVIQDAAGYDYLPPPRPTTRDGGHSGGPALTEGSIAGSGLGVETSADGAADVINKGTVASRVNMFDTTDRVGNTLYGYSIRTVESRTCVNKYGAVRMRPSVQKEKCTDAQTTADLIAPPPPFRTTSLDYLTRPPMPVLHIYEEPKKDEGKSELPHSNGCHAAGGYKTTVEVGTARLVHDVHPEPRRAVPVGALNRQLRSKAEAKQTAMFGGSDCSDETVGAGCERSNRHSMRSSGSVRNSRVCDGPPEGGYVARCNTPSSCNRYHRPEVPDLLEEEGLLKDVSRKLELLMASINRQDKRMDTMQRSFYTQQRKNRTKEECKDKSHRKSSTLPRNSYRSLDILSEERADGYDCSDDVITEELDDMVFCTKKQKSGSAKKHNQTDDQLLESSTPSFPEDKKRRLRLLSCIR